MTFLEAFRPKAILQFHCCVCCRHAVSLRTSLRLRICFSLLRLPLPRANLVGRLPALRCLSGQWLACSQLVACSASEAQAIEGAVFLDVSFGSPLHVSTIQYPAQYGTRADWHWPGGPVEPLWICGIGFRFTACSAQGFLAKAPLHFHSRFPHLFRGAVLRGVLFICMATPTATGSNTK